MNLKRLEWVEGLATPLGGRHPPHFTWLCMTNHLGLMNPWGLNSTTELQEFDAASTARREEPSPSEDEESEMSSDPESEMDCPPPPKLQHRKAHPLPTGTTATNRPRLVTVQTRNVSAHMVGFRGRPEMEEFPERHPAPLPSSQVMRVVPPKSLPSSANCSDSVTATAVKHDDPNTQEEPTLGNEKGIQSRQIVSMMGST
ncbi:unnamed protein product [Cyprideis torosa]|uniref:Uncharacterized protein n=1 Tax=Cyprideis torosa TaxID=163714 RepID=A0A7R8WLP9_9CRUS|nr:unnamed protein product [Cyprideis torosa]CAG0904523.1 unnamed protein product [Cyprideis torosa]